MSGFPGSDRIYSKAAVAGELPGPKHNFTGANNQPLGHSKPKGPFGAYNAANPNGYGGASSKKHGGKAKRSAPKWTATARKVTLDDGSKRVLYKNPEYPGETRIRKMRKGRDGRMKAVYVTAQSTKNGTPPRLPTRSQLVLERLL